jgi:hypothetical protein
MDVTGFCHLQVFMHSSSDVFISNHESKKIWSVFEYGETWTVLFNVSIMLHFISLHDIYYALHLVGVHVILSLVLRCGETANILNNFQQMMRCGTIRKN